MARHMPVVLGSEGGGLVVQCSCGEFNGHAPRLGIAQAADLLALHAIHAKAAEMVDAFPKLPSHTEDV